MIAIFRTFLLAVAVATTASAGLLKQDFLAPNDGLLVRDTVTNLEWLTPVYTKGNTYNNLFVQGVLTTYGFRYATATEVTSMVNSNFGNPTTISPGDVAGFTAAAQFFGYFGIAENVFCSGGPCPRTQGLTSTPGSGGGAHLGFGMIQLGPTGWFIMNNNWPDTSADQQMGSWLVRTSTVGDVPEPGTMVLMGMGLIGLAWRRVSASRR